MKITVPKAQRLTLTLAGRTNAGKSSLLNRIAGEAVAIPSPQAGTTTDVVEKAMELRPFGAVLWLDTAGWDDSSALGAARKARADQAFARADILIGVVSACADRTPDETLLQLIRTSGKPVIVVITHTDLCEPSEELLAALGETEAQVLQKSADRDTFLSAFKGALTAVLPREFLAPPELLAGIVPSGGTVLQIIPIDAQAPKGRLILPQVNVLRNALDRDYLSVVVTENRIAEAVTRFRPDLAICDSQVVGRMIAELPPDLPATTYSILMARLKGDLPALAAGAAAIRRLQDGDTVLIAEACTHHAAEDDIGRVKIPALLRKKTGKDLRFEVASGKAFPADLSRFALVIHCGGCMINRAFMLWRIDQAQGASVPITNYGVAISEAQGVLDRVLRPFNIRL